MAQWTVFDPTNPVAVGFGLNETATTGRGFPLFFDRPDVKIEFI
jgi:hypothetical protein